VLSGMAQRLRDPTVFQVRPDVKYAIFVSYMEIYNENIYDLLEKPPGK
jgi:hypothetical protein